MGLESFTPDGTELVGESPDVPGLYVCAGLNSHGITCGPAAGGAVAEWIDDGGNSMTRDWYCQVVLVYARLCLEPMNLTLQAPG